MQNTRLSAAVRNALVAASLATVAVAAQAQQAPSATGAASLEEVVVTGSRIARPELESTTPITILNAAEIKATGNLNTADVLRTLPAVGLSGISGSNSNFLTSSAGVNTINLRNLGDSRTLVLVNGRRMVPGIAGDSAADFNMIPTDFIERIDVITGGASAVYGSEAVAGVVNVVLKEHFNGVTIRGQGGGATQGGENTKLGSLTLGSDFAEGRGNAFFNIQYDKDSGLYSRQRALSHSDTFIGNPTIYGVGSYSSYNPQGNFVLADGNLNAIDGFFTYDPTIGDYTYFDGSQGFDRNKYRRITIPIDRTLVSGVVRFDLAEKQQIYTEFTYGQTHTESDIEPFALEIGPALSTDNVYAGLGGIPITNAYIPQTLRDIIAADNADPNATGGCSDGVAVDCISFLGARKRLVDVAIRSSSARRQTTRLVAGFKGSLFSTPWDYDVYYQFGRTTDNQTSTGQVNVLNLRYALDSVADASGNIVCRDAVAQAQGCVPINVFGFNSITPAAAAYINSPGSRDVAIQQQVVSAVLQGPVIKLPAGEVRAVVGAERRTEQSSEVQDSLTNSGLNGGNALPNVFGSYTVKELFGEIAVPLLANLPAVKDLSLEAAVRTSDYSTVGRVSTWNVRLNYAPIEDVRLRGTYSKSVRAPNIGELFSAPGQTFPTGIHDPCNNVTTSTTGAVADACRAIPAIAAAIAPGGGGFHYGLLDTQVITGYNGGNIHLGPETAKSYTFGLVFTPAALRNFNASLDFYDIKISDAVGTVDYPTEMSQCLLTGSPTFCNAVFRDPNTGKIIRIDQTNINVDTLATKGIDLQLRYKQPLPEKFGSAITVGLNLNHLKSFDQISPGAPTVSYLGVIGYPKNKASLQIDYEGYGLDIGWTMRYQSATQDQTDPANVDITQLPFNNVPAYTYHDLQVRYTFDKKVKTSIYGGVRNVFDKQAPFLPSGMANEVTGVETAPDAYDAIGRQFFVGVEVHMD